MLSALQLDLDETEFHVVDVRAECGSPFNAGLPERT
jgi:hypothetical protein